MTPHPPKTAIIGAAGFVGRVLFDSQRQLHPDTIGTDWRGREGFAKLDLASPDIRALRLAETGHTWAVIAAGAVNWRLCEKDREFTRLRNVTGTLALASQLTAAGIGVVYISSDGVFEGDQGGYSENSPRRPINEYGRQKVEVEDRLPEATQKRGLVLRVGRVVGMRRGDNTLCDEVSRRLVAGETVEAARDQIFTPIVVEDLPWILQELQAREASGVFNVGGPEAWSRFDIALHLADALGADKKLVKAISLSDIADGLVRPKDLSMRCERLRQALSRDLTPLSRCMEKVVENYHGAHLGGRS